MSSTNSAPRDGIPNKGGRPPAERRIRIVADRRITIDHYKLARALLRLAQDEYDRAHDPPPQPDAKEPSP